MARDRIDVGGNQDMLIVNEDQLRLAGIESLEERCVYCSKRLAAYPLIMSDDMDQTVYHMTCALELASDLLADVFTFFSPPPPYPPLFVLTTPNAASANMPRSEGVQAEGVTHAINRSSSD
jgi:hypothetical protein